MFDPVRILDTATFEEDLSYSVGVEHVLVNGEFVVRDGENVEGAQRQGRAVVGTAGGFLGSSPKHSERHRVHALLHCGSTGPTLGVET